MHEWPLVLFTLMLQASAGAFCLAQRTCGSMKNQPAGSLKASFLFKLLVITGAGLAVSFFHLGSPLNAFHALNNILMSWMSREILLTMLFFGGMAVYWLAAVKKWLNKTLYSALGIFTCLAGVCVVYSMARIYMMPAVPAWNTWNTIASFFISAVLLGSFLVISAMPSLSEKERSFLSGLALFSIALKKIIFIFWLIALSAGETAAQASLILLTRDFPLLLAVFFIFMASALILAIHAKSGKNRKILMYAFALAAAGEIIGRILFYAAFVRTGI